MNIVSWTLFGLIVGIIANAIDSRPAQGGLLGAILLGIAGALIGGFLGTMLFGVGLTSFNMSSFLISVAGALLLLLVGRSFYNRRTV